MLLKIGELARRTGVTVRALHHYDEIGLLAPSGRSDAGYRLYNGPDIERLHTIQALRHLGLPLDDIGRALAEEGSGLPGVIARQLAALNADIAKAEQLRSQLRLIQTRIASGVPPESGDWLSSLSLMATHGRYFSAAELRLLFDNWQRDAALWPPLIAAMQEAIDAGAAPDGPVAQRLASRWVEISLQWMDGDLDLLQRWDAMLQQEPIAMAQSRVDPAVLAFFHAAMQCRKAAYRKYPTAEQFGRLRLVPQRDWQVLDEAVLALAGAAVPFGDVRAGELLQRWQDLLDHASNGEPEIKAALLAAVRIEPVLQAGLVLSDAARAYLRGASAVLHRTVQT
jgi:DNA-binding transcriptional MerR regulator